MLFKPILFSISGVLSKAHYLKLLNKLNLDRLHDRLLYDRITYNKIDFDMHSCIFGLLCVYLVISFVHLKR